MLLLQATPPTSILDQFQTVRTVWFDAIFPLANTLFGILALIEMAITGTFLVLERSDWLSWTAGLMRKVLWLGAFYALLLFGRTWMPAIINSLSMVGGIAAGIGTQGVSPGLVWSIGWNIAGQLFSSGSGAGFLSPTAIATELSLTLAGVCVFLSFVGICLGLVMALIESYITVGAGVIFLGLGGSRLTTPYVERYICLAVAIGIKLMVLQLLVRLSMNMAQGWIEAEAAVPAQDSPAMSAWGIAGSAILLLVICWQSPKFIATMIGGSPAFSGGDVIGMGVGALEMGAGAAMFAATGMQLAGASTTAAAAAGGGSNSAMSVSAAAGLGAGGSGAAAGVPPAPGSPGPPGNGGGGSAVFGFGKAAMMANAGSRIAGAIPNAEAAAPPPPPVNLKGDE